MTNDDPEGWIFLDPNKNNGFSFLLTIQFSISFKNEKSQ